MSFNLQQVIFQSTAPTYGWLKTLMDAQKTFYSSLTINLAQAGIQRPAGCLHRLIANLRSLPRVGQRIIRGQYTQILSRGKEQTTLFLLAFLSRALVAGASVDRVPVASPAQRRNPPAKHGARRSLAEINSSQAIILPSEDIPSSLPLFIPQISNAKKRSNTPTYSRPDPELNGLLSTESGRAQYHGSSSVPVLNMIHVAEYLSGLLNLSVDIVRTLRLRPPKGKNNLFLFLDRKKGMMERKEEKGNDSPKFRKRKHQRQQPKRMTHTRIERASLEWNDRELGVNVPGATGLHTPSFALHDYLKFGRMLRLGIHDEQKEEEGKKSSMRHEPSPNRIRAYEELSLARDADAPSAKGLLLPAAVLVLVGRHTRIQNEPWTQG
ncbi:hypothetical protein B0H14DRAFT_2608662 [Mycena olivaceomarginata]|nr:hypothetical protein B0H14DRAFT_2608662 [Mycena olivaceomarginata]